MKLTMALGIFAMVLRYAFCAYALDVDGLYWGAIVVHGIIFGFFFVTAQMYMAKRRPKNFKPRRRASSSASLSAWRRSSARTSPTGS